MPGSSQAHALSLAPGHRAGEGQGRGWPWASAHSLRDEGGVIRASGICMWRSDCVGVHPWHLEAGSGVVGPVPGASGPSRGTRRGCAKARWCWQYVSAGCRSLCGCLAGWRLTAQVTRALGGHAAVENGDGVRADRAKGVPRRRFVFAWGKGAGQRGSLPVGALGGSWGLKEVCRVPGCKHRVRGSHAGVSRKRVQSSWAGGCLGWSNSCRRGVVAFMHRPGALVWSPAENGVQHAGGWSTTSSRSRALVGVRGLRVFGQEGDCV